jgi:hypothetical protein
MYAQVQNHGVVKGLVLFLAYQIPNEFFFIFIINKGIDFYPSCSFDHYIWVIIEAKSFEMFVQLNHLD